MTVSNDSNSSTNEQQLTQFVLQVNPKDTYKLTVSSKNKTFSFKMQEVKS